MSIPANLTIEGAPYGPQPVARYVGPQGGPYVADGPVVTPLLPLASRTASSSVPIQANYRYRGLYLVLSVTVNPGGAQTLGVLANGYDSPTGNNWVLLTVAASATPGGIWCLYPGLSGAAVEGVSVTRNLILPQGWYVNVNHSGAGAWTYALTAQMLP